MNPTRPLRIIWFTSSPLTRAARGSSRAASAVTVDLPAPGIPDTITHPDKSPEVMGSDPPNGFAAQQLNSSGSAYGPAWPSPPNRVASRAPNSVFT
jgi:hypothetical protein